VVVSADGAGSSVLLKKGGKGTKSAAKQAAKITTTAARLVGDLVFQDDDVFHVAILQAGSDMKEEGVSCQLTVRGTICAVAILAVKVLKTQQQNSSNRKQPCG
jgi:hypothetical protein